MVSKFRALNTWAKIAIGCSSIVVISCCSFFGLATVISIFTPSDQGTSATRTTVNKPEIITEIPKEVTETPPEEDKTSQEISNLDDTSNPTATTKPVEVIEPTQTSMPTSDPAQFLDIQIEKNPDKFDRVPSFGLSGGSGTGGSDVYFFIDTIGEDASPEGGGFLGAGKAKIELEYQIIDSGVVIESHRTEAERVTGIGYRYEIRKENSNTLPRTSDYDGLTFIINLYANGYLLDTFQAIKDGYDWLPVTTNNQEPARPQVAEERARCARQVSQRGRSEPEYVGLQGYLVAGWDSDYDKALPPYPWVVPLYEQVGPDLWEEGEDTLPAKTPVTILEQHLTHEGYGRYSGFLIVQSQEDGKEYRVDHHRFAPVDYWTCTPYLAVRHSSIIARVVDSIQPISEDGKWEEMGEQKEVLCVDDQGFDSKDLVENGVVCYMYKQYRYGFGGIKHVFPSASLEIIY